MRLPPDGFGRQCLLARRFAEAGLRFIDGRVHIHDWHATILHQLGLDHERLTYRYAGREMRLTDVAGSVAREILL